VVSCEFFPSHFIFVAYDITIFVFLSSIGGWPIFRPRVSPTLERGEAGRSQPRYCHGVRTAGQGEFY
jgi:hypothetical protein